MKLKKLVYVSPRPFNLRERRRLGIEKLLDRGRRVEYWDLSSPWSDGSAVEEQPIPPVGHDDLVKQYRSRGEALEKLESLGPDTVAVPLLALNARHLDIYRALGRSRCVLGTQYLNYIPTWSNKRCSLTAKIGEKIARPWQLLSTLKGKAAMVVSNTIRRADFCLAGGQKSLSMIPLRGDRTDIAWCHALDYDIYLQVLEETCEKLGYGSDSAAVFLDEIVPNHPDYEELGLTPYVDAEQYYEAMKRCFEHIERRYDLRVIVAAHPKRKWTKDSCYWGEYCVDLGRTAQLVRSADLVVAHASTALSFAVLFKKPVLLVTMDAFSDTRIGVNISGRGELLSAPVINADDIDVDTLPAWDDIEVEEAAYKEYKTNYIKVPGSPRKYSWEIIDDFLRGAYDE